MDRPLVTIIIPCYNAERYVGEAIESALGQTYAEKEAIVIDDGSTDGSLDVIRSFGRQVRWETGPNRGGCAARNRGLALARGELIQFLDADDLLHSQKLARQVPAAVAHPERIVYCDWEERGPDGRIERSAGDAIGDPVLFVLRAGRLAVECPLHARQQLLAIGGFREELPCSQERDLHLRLACMGTTFGRLPEVLFTVRHVEGSISSDYVRVLDQHSRVLGAAYEQLRGSGQLTDARAAAFAGFLARDARVYAARGYTSRARAYFRQARQMHRGGGLDTAYYRTVERLLYSVAGPIATERAVQWKRRLVGRSRPNGDVLPGCNGRSLRTGKALPSSPFAGARSAVPIQYLVHREGLSSVFPAQVAAPLAGLRSRGCDIRLGVFAAPGEFLRPALRRRWRDVRARLRDFGVPLRRLPSPPARARGLWNEATLLGVWLRGRYGPSRPVVLHCRGSSMATLALEARRRLPMARVIYDCRGVEHAELRLEGLTEAEVEASRGREARAARDCDRMICVSQAMADYVASEYGVPREKIAVVPCCVDVERCGRARADRDRVRGELSLTDRFVVAYCGSLRRWQLPDRCVDVFLTVRQVEPRSHFLALTTEPRKMTELLVRRGLRESDATVLSVPHAEVPRYLAAADLGLLLREPSPVNRVASPVKFAEYLACGLPVVISEGIGDFSELTRREEVGAVLPHHASSDCATDALSRFLSAQDGDLEDLRRRCRAVAKENLAIDVHLPRIAAIYDELAQ